MNRTFIMDEPWDYLIILDACRHDVFVKVYSEYLDGKLERRDSAGTSTVDWRDKALSGNHGDVVYVSSNPYISSTMPVKGYRGSDHFARVYDVWSSAWDQERGTVLPASVTSAALLALKHNPEKRLIVHYLQPHAPYLNLDLDTGGFPAPDLSGGRVLTGVEAGGEKGVRAALLRLLAAICYKTGILGENPTWKLRQWLGMAPASPMDAVRRKYGDRGLRTAYRENLRLVLREVAELVRHLAGRIIVTSDHGELLGEKGRYSHFGGSDDPLLTGVPWLVIDKKDREEIVDSGQGKEPATGQSGGEDEAKIKARLRALGYLD
jgi:hypothetical protein